MDKIYRIENLTEDLAKEICSWKYEGEYSVYDFPSWEECKRLGWSIASEEKRFNAYFAIFKEETFFAFIHIMDRKDHIELGVGIKPSFCGRHEGKIVMKIAIEKIKELFGNLPIQLSVRTFNTRAIKCYQSVGFKIVEKYIENGHHACGEMYLMKYE